MTPLQQLKEDYERRAEAAERRYHATPSPRQSDVLGKMRANIYREFAYELGKLMPEGLPEFLYEDDEDIKIGRHGDSVVTEEWNNYIEHDGPVYNAAGKQINDLDI